MSHTFKTNRVQFIHKKKRLKGTKKTSILTVLRSEMDEKLKDSLNTMKYGFILLAGVLLFSSCVSKKSLVTELNSSTQYAGYLKDLEDKNQSLLKSNSELAGKVNLLKNQLANEQSKNNMPDRQMNYYQGANTNLPDRLTDMSEVSKTGAESIRKSLEGKSQNRRTEIILLPKPEEFFGLLDPSSTI